MKRKITLLLFWIMGVTQLINAQTLVDGLMSYYKLDEISGAAIDSHGTNDGTNNGATTTNVSGVINTAYDFDGTDDYIDLGNNFDFTNGYSISFWANIDAIGDDAIISQGYGIMCWLQAGELRFYQNTGIRATVTNIPLNTWIHIVLVWDKLTCKIYINGTLEANGNFGDAPYAPTTVPVRIGHYHSVPYSYDGSVDELGIWGRALTQVEITQLYNTGAGLAYPFDSSTPPSTSVWQQSGTDIYYNAGNVGIGTTTPSEKLEIIGNIDMTGLNRRIYLGGVSGSTYGIAFNSVYPDYGIFYTEGNPDFVSISPNGNSTNGVLNIYGNGNVGIGTTTPDYKLDVLGTIRANEIKVETGWSDFVFEPDYKLMGLKELETYIQQNKHLPEIPTEAEVKENGISVGEMNAKLLQKIEELTLYTIEQQNVIEDLQKRLEMIENK